MAVATRKPKPTKRFDIFLAILNNLIGFDMNCDFLSGITTLLNLMQCSDTLVNGIDFT